MAFEIRKTNHTGAENGGGAWCSRAIAKVESSRVRRRVDDPVAVSDGLADFFAGRTAGRQLQDGPSHSLWRQLPFKAR